MPITIDFCHQGLALSFYWPCISSLTHNLITVSKSTTTFYSLFLLVTAYITVSAMLCSIQLLLHLSLHIILYALLSRISLFPLLGGSSPISSFLHTSHLSSNDHLVFLCIFMTNSVMTPAPTVRGSDLIPGMEKIYFNISASSTITSINFSSRPPLFTLLVKYLHHPPPSCSYLLCQYKGAITGTTSKIFRISNQNRRNNEFNLEKEKKNKGLVQKLIGN